MKRIFIIVGIILLTTNSFSFDNSKIDLSKVKKYEGGMIIEPHTIYPNATGKQALEIMTTKNFSGLRVTE